MYHTPVSIGFDRRTSKHRHKLQFQNGIKLNVEKDSQSCLGIWDIPKRIKAFFGSGNCISK